jgi:hypothetical protein
MENGGTEDAPRGDGPSLKKVEPCHQHVRNPHTAVHVRLACGLGRPHMLAMQAGTKFCSVSDWAQGAEGVLLPPWLTSVLKAADCNADCYARPIFSRADLA